MSVDPEDCDERQARLDWMIEEFRKAQTRRRVKTNEKAVEPPSESDSTAPVTGQPPHDTRPSIDHHSR
jgi:hypothetical protein